MAAFLDRRELLCGAAAALLAPACKSAPQEAELGPWIAPAELAARLEEVRAGTLVVLYVGPEVLFERGHVPGARPVAPAEDAEGMKKLDAALAALSPDTEVVLYCGCCAVRDCPNVRPASAKARARGKTRVLDLPTRFATDWSGKGFPVARGAS